MEYMYLQKTPDACLDAFSVPHYLLLFLRSLDEEEEGKERCVRDIFNIICLFIIPPLPFHSSCFA